MYICNMKKQEFIDRYGEEAYKELLKKKRDYYKNNREHCKLICKTWNDNNADRVKENQRLYREKHKEKLSSKNKEYREQNKEQLIECLKQYRKEHKEELSEKAKNKRNTQEGRALNLINSYRTFDKNRGYETELPLNWIIERIFNSTCVYCGESDWHKLGCDRIDNTKGHTTDNVVCSCLSCNAKRRATPFQEFLNSQNPSGASDILTSLGLQPTPRTESQGN